MRTILATALTLALAGSGWTADGDQGMEHGKGGPGRGGPGERMAKRLDLTPEQSTKIKALMETHRKSTRDLRDKQQDAMRALRHLVEDKASDAQLTAKLNELKVTREALQSAKKKHMEEMAKILTPMQQAKFVAGMGRGAGRMGPGMRGGGKRGGDRGGDDRHDDDDEDDD